MQKVSSGIIREGTPVRRSRRQASTAAKVGCPGQQNFVSECAGAGRVGGQGREGKNRAARGGGVRGRWIKISRRLGAKG